MEDKNNNSPIKYDREWSKNSSDEVGLWQTQSLIHMADEEFRKFNNAKSQLNLTKNVTSKAITSYNKYKKNYNGIFYILIAVLIFVGIFYCWGTLVFAFDYIAPDLSELIFANYFLAFVMMIVPPVILTAIVMVIIVARTSAKTKQLKTEVEQGYLTPEEIKKCEQCEAIMANSKEKLMSVLSTLDHSILPKDYHSVYAVDWIVKAMENKRADTLKEAINLFEQYKAIEEIKGEIRYTRDSISDAISNIEVNNYYSYY